MHLYCYALVINKKIIVRDLYPYQMKLASIDNMRFNGTFCDEEGNIPEGQAICVALLSECYDILHELIALADS
jgi:hypothetical protein